MSEAMMDMLAQFGEACAAKHVGICEGAMSCMSPLTWMWMNGGPVRVRRKRSGWTSLGLITLSVALSECDSNPRP